MAGPAVATATAASSMDVVKEYSTGPLAVRAVRKLNVLALSLLIVPLRLWDAPQVLLSRRQVTAVQREDVPRYADPGQVADLLAAVRVDSDVAAAEPFLRRDLTITAAARPAPRARPPANLIGVLYPAGRILLAAIIEEGA
jgi:hypothetical protein